MAKEEKVTLESVQVEIDSLKDNFKELGKKFNSIQRSLDAIYQDRDLLTDIQNDISQLKRLTLSADQHNEALSNEVKDTVETKVDEVKNKVVETTMEVNAKTDEVKESIPHKVISGIMKGFEKKDITPKKKSLWHRLTGIFHFGIK